MLEDIDPEMLKRVERQQRQSKNIPISRHEYYDQVVGINHDEKLNYIKILDIDDIMKGKNEGFWDGAINMINKKKCKRQQVNYEQVERYELDYKLDVANFIQNLKDTK